MLTFTLQFGQTPLYAASFNGNLAVVKLLIAAGAELNLQREVRAVATVNTLSQ